MSKNNNESKLEDIVKWVVVAIFAGLVGLFIWSRFTAQDRENAETLRKLQEINRR